MSAGLVAEVHPVPIQRPPPPQTQVRVEPAPDFQAPDAYTKLVKSPSFVPSLIGLPKHVLKVRETSKLLLFIGFASAGLLMLDMSTKLILAIAKCSNQNKPPSSSS